MNLGKTFCGGFVSVISFCAVFVFSGASVAENSASQLALSSFSDTDRIGEDVARVVYYRVPAKDAGKTVANVYLDGDFVTALKPGSYTDFCVHPGSYAVMSSFKVAPLFVQGAGSAHVSEVRGGVTYFLRVNEASDGGALPVEKGQALQELKGVERENRLLSRASQAEPCFPDEHADES